MKIINFNDIEKSILNSYKNLENPEYFFVKKSYKRIKKSKVIWDLTERWYVKNSTGLNDDVALHLDIYNDETNECCSLALSFINNYSVLFRLKNNIYVDVITKKNLNISNFEKELILICEDNNWKFLDKNILSKSHNIKLSNTDKEDTTIYHALFSDSGVKMKVLK